MTKELIEASARSALELALEALENLINQHYAETTTNDDLEKADNAITAIKAALEAHKALMSFQDGAQPAVAEQHKQSTTCGEPVAYLVYDHGAESQYLAFDDELGDMDGCEVTSLYTTPPPVPKAHKRKPLTDEQIEAIHQSTWMQSTATLNDFARAIEAAHGIMSDTDGKE